MMQTTSTKRRSKPRRAFTLMEIMLVIAILGVVAGLWLSGVMGGGATARRAMVAVQLRNLEKALDDFKARYGVHPPSSIVLRENGDYSAAGDYDSDGDTDVEDARRLAQSRRWLRRIWPGLLLAGDNGFTGWDFDNDGAIDTDNYHRLDGFKCLLFFLYGMPEVQTVGGETVVILGTGFAKNPANPFERGGQRVGPFFDGLKSDDLRAGRDDEFDTGSGNASGEAIVFYEVADPLRNGQSLAYFSSYEGSGYRPQDCSVSDEPTLVFGINGVATSAMTGPNPYTRDWPDPDSTASPARAPFFPNEAAEHMTVFWKAKGVQIISAGDDGQFGRGGEFQLNYERANQLHDRDHDNLTNFCARPLYEAAMAGGLD